MTRRILLSFACLLFAAPAHATADGTWSRLYSYDVPPFAGPGPRLGHVLVYDPPRDRLLLHGGVSGSFFLPDLWEFPLATNGPWHELHPFGTDPAGRAFHSAIYDPVGDRMILFGGFAPGALSETWALDLADSLPFAWHLLAPTGTAPAARYWHSAMYDAQIARMTIFGGQSGSTFFNDTRELVLLPGSEAWVAPEAALGTPPSARCCQEALFVPGPPRIVMFGGWNGSTELGDFWTLPFDSLGAGWMLLSAGGAISARTDHVAVFDRVRNRMVVFGGVKGPTRLGDAWATTLAGPALWDSLETSDTPPAPRSDHAAVYDPVRDRMIVFGGNNGDFMGFGDLWALTFGADTQIHASCSGGGPVSPGDSVTVTFDVTNPFSSETTFESSHASARAWPLASGGGTLHVDGPNGHLVLGVVVPDTAAIGPNELTIRVWVADAPVLADSCVVHFEVQSTAARPTLIEAGASASEVRLSWFTGGGTGLFTLARQAPGDDWRTIALLQPDGTGRIMHVDRDVAAGGRYGYRLRDDATDVDVPEVWVDVPTAVSFAFHRVWYDHGSLWLDVSMRGTDGARIELFDVAGRVRFARQLDHGADERRQLSVPCRVTPGVYFARFTQGGRTAQRRLLVTR